MYAGFVVCCRFVVALSFIWAEAGAGELALCPYVCKPVCMTVCTYVCVFVFLHMPNIIARRVAHTVSVCVFASGSPHLCVCVSASCMFASTTKIVLRHRHRVALCLSFVVRTLVFGGSQLHAQGCFLSHTKKMLKGSSFFLHFRSKILSVHKIIAG